MITIPLGATRRCKHTGKYSVIIDAIDAAWAVQFNWTADLACNGQRVYAVRRVLCADGVKRKVYMHREIWARAHGAISQAMQIDHKEHGAVSGLDNRRSNLRLANQSQNLGNERLRSDSTSGYRGVSWDRNRRKWIAYINHRGTRTRLGAFSDPVAAARAYDAAAVEVFGEFARPNFGEGRVA